MRFPVPIGRLLVFARPAAAVFIAGVSVLAAGRVRATEPAGTAFKAGVAVRVITPSEALWMAGYGNRTKAAEGKIQDLYVKALAVEDSAGGRLVLLTSDLVGFQRSLTEAVAEEVRRRTGLPRKRLLLTASHTHAGPLLRGPFVDHFDLPPEQVKKVEEYTDRLRDWMVEAIVAALAELRPAQLAVGRGTTRFAMNRRGVGGYNPEGPVDHDVPVLRIESPEGKLRAVIFGYACYNVTLQSGKEFYRWCGDYAGFAQAYLEEKHPGSTALFWCGCGGDARPRPLGTVAICQRHGRELADAVESVLAGHMTPVHGEAAARYALVSLPFGPLPSKEKLIAERLSKRPDVRKRAVRLLKTLDTGGKIDDHYRSYPIQLWRLGDGPLWVSLGGEVLVDYALRLKRELGRERPLWVTAYANDVMAYIPSRRVLQEGGYEGDTSMSVYGLPAKSAPPLEDTIVDKVHELVKEVMPKKSASSPLSPKEELATFHVAKGFRVELVACEPAVIDPVAMAFDEDGRMFVAEMRGYNGGDAIERIQRNTSGTTKGQGSAASNRAAGIDHLTSGTIKLLEDRDGDGFYEHSSRFADKLRLPTSVMPYKGGVLAAVAPDLLYLEDTKGDGRSDRHRVLYTGFGTKNPQGLINGLQWGLDNWVYGNASHNGGTVRSTEKPDQPAVTLYSERSIRFHPDKPGSLEPTSGGGQHGLTADDWEQWFVNTNNKHLRHVVLPDHYLRRNPALAVSKVTLDIPDGQDGHDAACKVYRISLFEPWRIERARRNRELGAWWLWSQEKQHSHAERGNEKGNRSLLPSSEMSAGGYITAACSPLVYTADLFPESYRGNTFICEPANNLIHRDVLVPKGATFVARRREADSEFLASTDPWFRPVHLSIGPDGALYVLDFYREVIEDAPDIPQDVRKALKLNTGSSNRGRIWRIVPEGAPQSKRPALRRAATPELVKHLANGNSWWRLTAQRLLVERQDKAAVPLLEKLAREATLPVGRAHALWALQGLGALDDTLIEQALRDPSAGVREQALRLAEAHLAVNARLRAAVTALAKDDSLRVRFQLAFTLGESNSPEVVAALAQVARRDAADPWIQTAVLSSVSRTAPALLQMLARDREFTGKATEAQLQLLTRLAALVGARAVDTELAQAMHLLPASAEDDSAGWSIALLEGLGQGLQNGRRSPGRLWEQPPPALRESVARLRPFFQRAAALAQDDKRAVGERIAAARRLGYGPFAVAAPALQELLAPRHSAEIQLAAVRALALHDNPRVAEMLLDGWNRFTPTVRREALEALFARADRLSQLLTALEQKKVLAVQLEPARVEQLRKHPNGELRRRAQTLLAASTPDRKKVVEEYRSTLQLKADAARGKVVFQKTCATCHRLGDVGTEVGPDLASALRNKTPEGLLTDILDPSREVDPRYINYLVTTSSGRTFTGLIAAETAASITLRRAETAEDTILRTQIEEIQGTGKSVMPEGLEGQLSKQDVADVIAYLLSQAAPK